MLDWLVEVKTAAGCETRTGLASLSGGSTHIVCTLPYGELKSAVATLSLSIEDGEKIFMNGYQTWTNCPEYTRQDKIRGLNGLPKAVINKFGLDRYGDYHFVSYPYRRGVTHGFSWAYFRLGQRYRLIASLDERPGYTMFSYDSSRGLLTIARDCAGVKCGGEFHAFDLYYAEGSEEEVFDGWFSAMSLPSPAAEPLRGYSSWYNRYENITEQTILSDLVGCKTLLSPGDLFQIDDGWEPAVGDWLEPDKVKFPGGMKPLADAIHDAGFKAGLWLAPFVCRKDSLLIREHPDWLLKVNGNPWSCGCNWGGFYSLDIDKPQVQEYLSRVFHRVFDEWGFDLVKLDFLYGAAPFGTAHESRAGRMIRAMDLLRQLCAGKLILGCGVPLMPAFGRVDYCRISCDVGLDWDDKLYMRLIHRERVSTKQAIENTVFRRQLNGRAFLNDPDVFFLRDENLRLSDEQKQLLARVNALLGGVFLMSDDPSTYTDEQRQTYRELVHLSEAEQVRVDADEMCVYYVLDGKQQCLSLPKDWF